MRKRSKYRPKPIISPLDYLSPADKKEATKQMLPIRTALALIEVGKQPGTEEWRHLSDCVNITEQLAKMGRLPAETLDIAESAVQALVRASVRYVEGRGMRLDGEGIASLRACVDIYDQAIGLLRKATVYKAQREVIEETARILSGGAPREGVTIVQM